MENKEHEAMEAAVNVKEGHVKENHDTEPPAILEEIQIEELAIDGICGIY
jgi:mycofactocin precursor